MPKELYMYIMCYPDTLLEDFSELTFILQLHILDMVQTFCAGGACATAAILGYSEGVEDWLWDAWRDNRMAVCVRVCA